MHHRFHFLVSAFAVLLLLPLGSAAGEIQTFRPDLTISDGRDGRVFAKCFTVCQEKPITRVTAKVSRLAGGGDTYINARFGKDGKAFNGGKRIPVLSERPIEVTWTVPEQVPAGRPIVINAYNGTVRVHDVTTFNDGGRRPDVRGERPRSRGQRDFGR